MKSQNWLFQDLDFPRIFKKYNVEFPRAKEEMTKIFLGNKEKITLKEFAFIPNKCHIILQDFLGINNFVLSRISKGEITNQEIPVVFFPSFFWNSPIYRQEVNF